MTMLRRRSFAGLLPLVMAWSGLAVDTSAAVEIGMDAAVQFRTFSDIKTVDSQGIPTETKIADQVSLSLPTQSIRVGCFVGPSTQLESALGVDATKQGDSNLTALSLEFDLMRNFGGEQGATKPYVRAGGIVTYLDSSQNLETGTGAQLGIAAGIGVKLIASGPWALRLEGSGARLFKSDRRELPSSWVLSASVGISFFTQ